MTSCCVFCLQIHANTTTKSSTLRFILQTTDAPFYHRLMLVIEVLSSAATLIAQKNRYRGWCRGMGKGEGVNPSRPLSMAVFLLFPKAAHCNTHVFSLLVLHLFIQAQKRMSSVAKLLLRLLAVWRGLLLADSCFLHLQMHTRCLTKKYLSLISVSESPTRRNNTDEHRTFDDGRKGGEWSVFPRKLVFLEGGCLNCRQLNLVCLLLFEHSSKYKQDALHATFPLLRTPPLHSTCCFHATSAILGSFPSAIVVWRSGYHSSLQPFRWKQRDVIY